MYLNRKTGVLTYVPRPGETPSNSTVIAPYAAELILISNARTLGPPGRLVGRIVFSNLTFAHTNSPTLAQGYIGELGNHSEDPVGAITVIGGTGVKLDHVTITHIGEAAVIFGPGSNANEAKDSTLSDMGASAIIVGQEPRRNPSKYPDNLLNGPSTSEWNVGRATISNNLITDFGHVINNSTGVFFGRGVSNSIISHNEISVGPAWAILVGRDHGPTLIDPLFPGPRNNEISWNYIHDLGFGGDSTAQDWGAIYTIGLQDGTIVEYNRIEHVTTSIHPVYYRNTLNSHGRDGMLLYTDDHSHGITIRNNILSGSGNFLHSLKGTENVVSNNIFYSKNDSPKLSDDMTFRMLCWTHYLEEQGRLFGTITHNIFVIDRKTPTAIPVQLFGSANPKTEYGPDVLASDYNLYLQVGATITHFDPDYTLEAWRKTRGQDIHSLFNVDPLFVNPDAGDFRLQPGSPALGLGFVPFDLSAAGRK